MTIRESFHRLIETATVNRSYSISDRSKIIIPFSADVLINEKLLLQYQHVLFEVPVPAFDRGQFFRRLVRFLRVGHDETAGLDRGTAPLRRVYLKKKPLRIKIIVENGWKKINTHAEDDGRKSGGPRTRNE